MKIFGLDFVNFKYQKQHPDIAMGHTPGVGASATAELGLSLLLTTIRSFNEAKTRAIHQGEFDDNWLSDSNTVDHLEVCDLNVGFLGMGYIGSEFARRLITCKVNCLWF